MRTLFGSIGVNTSRLRVFVLCNFNVVMAVVLRSRDARDMAQFQMEENNVIKARKRCLSG